ncbi:MAG: glycosyltransferase family 9 protein [Bacteroidota bacterium]
MGKKKPSHILIIRLSAMGDVAMSVPVIRALTQQHPSTKITVLTRAFFKPLFRDINHVSVFEADLKGKHRGISGLWRLAKELKSQNLDVVADFHNVLRSNILRFFFFFFKIPFFQIDKGRKEKKALIKGVKFQQLKSTHQRYADVLKKAGLAVNLSTPIFPERKPLNKDLLNYIGKDTKKWIGIAPFAAFKGKMYPVDLMEQVIDCLAEKHKVILFGAGKEEGIVLDKLSKNKPQVINFANQFVLENELDVISNLDVMLSMDSANGHLAAMLGISVITLWGVTHPYAGFYPFNQDEKNAVLADRKQFPQIPTSVYGKKLPEGYDKAMRTISPEVVVLKVEQILE